MTTTCSIARPVRAFFSTLVAGAVAVLLAAPLAAGAAEEGVSGILKRLDQEKIEALEAYLKAHPDAEDVAAAQQVLVETFQSIGEPERAVPLLERMIAKAPTGKDMDPESYLTALNVLVQALDASGQRDKAKELVAKAREDIKGHELADRISEYVDQIAAPLKLPGVGDTLSLAFTGMGGEKVDLAEMKGKVVLVDYWATWCGPCVEELPSVKAAYDKYHAKGFEILGISLDEDKDALTAFIKEHEIPWSQDFTGKGWETELAARYGITSIPATFLVGKDGKIVARDLRGEALGEAVAKHLEL